MLPGILPAPPAPEKAGRAAVRARSSPAREAALVKTLPVRRPAQPRSTLVTSMPLGGLGRLRRGIDLEVSGELQVTVCLRPASGPRRRRGDCVGRLYGYDPVIGVRLALASTEQRSAADVFPLGRARSLRCRQQQPSRNHHCTISLPWRRLTLGRDGKEMPDCAPRSCRLNLLASARHPRAGSHHRVAVGGIDKRGRIDNVGESRVAAIRYSRRAPTATPAVAQEPRLAELPLVARGRKIRPYSVYSVPLPELRGGDRLKLDGSYRGAIEALPYNVRTRTRLVLGDSPGATTPGPEARRITRGPAFVTAASSFNCTRGRSGHRTPCPIRKTGILRIGSDSSAPLFANLIAGYGAIGLGSDRYKRGDRVQVRRRGFLKVWSYRR